MTGEAVKYANEPLADPAVLSTCSAYLLLWGLQPALEVSSLSITRGTISE